jgi:hypothetical protein
VQQSSESERVVREMEALLRADTTGLPLDVSAPPVARRGTGERQRVSDGRVKRR